MERITILSFSNRDNGNCSAISDYIADFLGDSEAAVKQMSGRFSPCSDCNYECLRLGVSCPSISAEQRAMMDSVLESDVVYYIIPNFCGFPCANYLSFNERCVSYFNMDRELMGRYMRVRKRFIVVSNTENDNFVMALRQQTATDPEILYMKTSKYKKQSIAGDILESVDAQADLEQFLKLPHNP